MTVGAANAVSARNQLSGQISEFRTGEAMSLVTITANGLQLTSAITNQAVQELGLRANDSVLALVKSTETMLIKGDAAAVKISARNKITGRVTDIQKGSAMACVAIDAGGIKLTSAITRPAIDDLQVRNGDTVTAVFKSTEVILQKT